MDDFYDDFGDDFEGMDGGFEDDYDDEPNVEEDMTESERDFWDGPGERDWAIIFPLAEEISGERRERRQIRKDFERKNNRF